MNRKPTARRFGVTRYDVILPGGDDDEQIQSVEMTSRTGEYNGDVTLRDTTAKDVNGVIENNNSKPRLLEQEPNKNDRCQETNHSDVIDVLRPTASPEGEEEDGDEDGHERTTLTTGLGTEVVPIPASPDDDAVDPGAYIPLTTVDDVRTQSGGASGVAAMGRQFAERKTRRLVFKDGTCNITSRNVTQRKRRYLVDIFTTLVDIRWRYSLLMFASAFLVTWFFFALVWFVIALAHGDVAHAQDDDWKSCASNVYDFPTALLFSIETQHTIGYGFRAMEPHCPDAFIVLMLQSCLGVFIQSMMTGIIFAKLSLPKRRAHTLMFSRKAVISKRDGEYCLLFRVGDMRKSHFVGTSIRALLVKDRLTSEGESIPLCQYPLQVQTETCSVDNFVFLVWPVTAVHKITSESPLWDVSAATLLEQQFEIIVILEGIIESTGMTTQVRTSYLPSEILWGHRPASLLAYQKENGHYRVDYGQFHAVVSVSMPDYSAKTLAEKRRLEQRRRSSVIGHPEEGRWLSVPSPINIRRSRLGMLKRMRSSFGFRKTAPRSHADGGRQVGEKEGEGGEEVGDAGTSDKMLTRRQNSGDRNRAYLSL